MRGGAGSGVCDPTSQSRLHTREEGLKETGAETERLRQRGDAVLLYERADVFFEH